MAWMLTLSSRVSTLLAQFRLYITINYKQTQALSSNNKIKTGKKETAYWERDNKDRSVSGESKVRNREGESKLDKDWTGF